ncbi:MAG TPA: pyridoxine 5'-phosphate synthase [Chiayiivirga sp.]|uniref:Pyridoxine 5'-phosphate synthase n=1 Tax=Denitratimonas tolerans TaxID=1338420 RepID=A0AAW9R8T6_9GAMM|nr:pyridoxine 5'-phosphate synthase [Chiayiivirga sp.]HRO86616.1 pyridoxine 5'-phosphate synthase [Chiayiivirga sp.]HRQ34861.1 pyridoxine 5'-phosphate synthase [Chiayiivirga sp.]
MTRLSVNLNKIAVLRNSRGGVRPDIVRAARTVLAAGAHGLTLHPRPDLRHVRPDDVRALAALTDGVEYNLEGNPFAPARGEYPGFLALVEEVRPDQATLVPDGDDQITSDHGFDLGRDCSRLAPLVAGLRASGARVSVFVDAGSIEGFDAARRIGVSRVEIYTGPYAAAFSRGDASAALAACAATARAAQAAGLEVNAGHDLDQANLGPFLRAVPRVAEVSIGHALIDDALYEGLDRTVRRYLAAIAAAAT